MDWIERTINKTLGDMCEVEMTGQEWDTLIAALRAAHEAGCPYRRALRDLLDGLDSEDKCWCLGASPDCPNPPICEACQARALLDAEVERLKKEEDDGE